MSWAGSRTWPDGRWAGDRPSAQLHHAAAGPSHLAPLSRSGSPADDRQKVLLAHGREQIQGSPFLSPCTTIIKNIFFPLLSALESSLHSGSFPLKQPKQT